MSEEEWESWFKLNVTNSRWFRLKIKIYQIILESVTIFRNLNRELLNINNTIESFSKYSIIHLL